MGAANPEVKKYRQELGKSAKDDKDDPPVYGIKTSFFIDASASMDDDNDPAIEVVLLRLLS